MSKLTFLIVSLLFVQTAQKAGPLNGVWRMRPPTLVGSTYLTEVRNGTYVCSPCADPINNMAIDGQDHAIPDSPLVFNIRSIGPRGIEVVRKTGGTVISRTIRHVSDDGRLMTILTIENLPNGDVSWSLNKREHVGRPVPGSHPFHGSWKDVSLETSPNAVQTFSYEETATTLKLTDIGPAGNRVVYLANFDGKEHPAMDPSDQVTVTVRRINDRTIEELWKQGGAEVSRTRIVISGDGKTLTQRSYRGTERIAEVVADKVPGTVQ